MQVGESRCHVDRKDSVVGVIVEQHLRQFVNSSAPEARPIAYWCGFKVAAISGVMCFMMAAATLHTITVKLHEDWAQHQTYT